MTQNLEKTFIWNQNQSLGQYFYTVSPKSSLKGQCHEIFCFRFFSWISFPPAPEYSIKTVSNFFENARRYLQLKVCHRCRQHGWQMEKIFNQKNFNNFVWSPLGSRGNIYINFCLQVYFQGSPAWYCSHYLPPVSTTQGKLVAKFATGVVDTGGKFAIGVVDTGGNLPPVSLTPLVHLDLRISPRIFEKIRNDPNVIIRGLGKVIREKTWSKKISWHCPFNRMPFNAEWVETLKIQAKFSKKSNGFKNRGHRPMKSYLIIKLFLCTTYVVLLCYFFMLYCKTTRFYHSQRIVIIICIIFGALNICISIPCVCNRRVWISSGYMFETYNVCTAPKPRHIVLSKKGWEKFPLLLPI